MNTKLLFGNKNKRDYENKKSAFTLTLPSINLLLKLKNKRSSFQEREQLEKQIKKQRLLIVVLLVINWMNRRHNILISICSQDLLYFQIFLERESLRLNKLISSVDLSV